VHLRPASPTLDQPASRRPLLKVVAVVVGALALLAGVAPLAQAATKFRTAAVTPTRLPVANAHLVNYYPASHGWTGMWTGWDAAEFDRDMTKVQSLGANAVRLIVHPQAFGYPAPTATMTARLASAVDIAAQHGLSVELTLFDWFSNYTDVAGSKTWATAMVQPFRNDVRVFAVELQNELPVENVAAVAWASAMLPHLASLGPIPTTVSVNGLPARLAALKTALGSVRPSFWSYHYYDQKLASGAYSAFGAAKSIAAPLPLFIGETGVDTWPRLGETQTAAEARQDHFYRAVFNAARAQGLPTPAPWTLFDFTTNSSFNLQTAPQYYFGLFRTDGSAKPAATSVRQGFTGAALASTFNGSFETLPSDVPAEWTLYLGDQASIAADTTVARTGAASLRVARSLGTPAGWPSAYTMPVEPVVPGRTYSLRGWGKGVDVTGANRLAITWYDANGAYLGVAPSSYVPAGTTDWQQLVATGVAPQNAAMLAINVQSTLNTGTIWVDDLTFG
jgi:hypothetical protein